MRLFKKCETVSEKSIIVYVYEEEIYNDVTPITGNDDLQKLLTEISEKVESDTSYDFNDLVIIENENMFFSIEGYLMFKDPEALIMERELKINYEDKKLYELRLIEKELKSEKVNGKYSTNKLLSIIYKLSPYMDDTEKEIQIRNILSSSKETKIKSLIELTDEEIKKREKEIEEIKSKNKSLGPISKMETPKRESHEGKPNEKENPQSQGDICIII